MEQLIKEAVRYLGYGKNAVDAQTLELIENSFRELQSAASRKSVYRIFHLSYMGGEQICFGNLEVKSKSLGKNLLGCDKIVLFGATLGVGVDQLLFRSSKTDMAKAVVLQACAAALLEEYCDECQDKIAEEMKKEDRFLRPRFSPGYGDFSIECQSNVIQMLDAAKTIGLTITESFMMVPSKSVTAVIGASKSAVQCHRQGCEVCGKRDCIYRR
ncbi:MAG: Vitamin B12 dependent methionine synthase activation subunit [Ruminococcus sp.]|nr:Vitamin B12 dependent methionine synthase activation subunit [Ruminococcus sp.]